MAAGADSVWTSAGTGRRFASMPKPVRPHSSVPARDTIKEKSSALIDSRSLKKPPLPIESSRLDPFQEESGMVGARLEATELGLS